MYKTVHFLRNELKWIFGTVDYLNMIEIPLIASFCPICCF